MLTGAWRRIAGLSAGCLLLAVPALIVLTTPRTPAGEVRVVVVDPADAPSEEASSEPEATFDEEGRRIIRATQRGPLVGTDMPDLSFTSFEGQRVSVRTFLGEPVVVNFYASWCPTCPDELSQYGALAAVLYGRVPFMAVAVRDTEADARALINQVNPGFPAGMDPDGAFARELLLLGVPGTIVVGPDGVIAADWRGPVRQSDLVAFLRDNYPDMIGGVLG